MKGAYLLVFISIIMVGYVFSEKDPTYYRDILPILQDKCQSCHRDNGIAPFPLLSYQDAKNYSGAIKRAITEKRMPPWFADSLHGQFINDRSLQQKDINNLVKWIDGGMLQGDAEDAPPSVTWNSDWQIGDPDLVLTMKDSLYIPDSGVVEYQYVVLPVNVSEDKFIERVEIRPGNLAVVHHIIAFIRPPGSSMLRNGLLVRSDEDKEFLTAYVPGGVPTILESGQAKLLKAGSDIVLQIHYQTNGYPTSDLSRIGLVFAKKPPVQRIITCNVSDRNIVIPPESSNYESVARAQINQDADLISMMPHMHSRGIDFKYSVIFPDGRRKTLLSIPHYDFNWQLTYKLSKKIHLPKGSVIEGIAHFDNSSQNPRNPDPKKEVRWGQQTWDEMMLGYFDIAIPVDSDVSSIVADEK